MGVRVIPMDTISIARPAVKYLKIPIVIVIVVVVCWCHGLLLLSWFVVGDNEVGGTGGAVAREQ